MASDSQNGRPNIRIEIKNLSEPMEVDDKSEEEGEIRENFPKLGSNSKLAELTGNENTNELKKNIVNLTELEAASQKLKDRARRFALKPDEISTFTEEDLHTLYLSLGITGDNADQFRFEAIHLKCSNQVGVDSVAAYFMDYAPLHIELVDDESYNIVWEDNLCAARTLFHISKVVKGMPVRVASEHIIDNFILEENEPSKDLELLAQNRQIELREDNLETTNELFSDNYVDISSINIPIPPGYWRLGKKLMDSYSVLMRFSMKTDKKPFQIDKYSKYYRNIFSNRTKQKGGIFSRNKDIRKDVPDKNPWGTLAKNWDEDVMFREKEWHRNEELETKNIPISVSENSETRTRLTAKRRLGDVLIEDDLTKESSNSQKNQSDESDQENRKKNSKMPRMRMYADDEEEKIKRKKLLQTLKKQTEKLKETEIPNCDLRNILRITNKRSQVVEHDEDLDLSHNLTNRKRKLVFTVSQDQRSKMGSPSIMSRLDKRAHKEPIVKEKRPISPIRFHRHSSKDRSRTSRKTSSEQRSIRKPIKREKSSDRKYEGKMYSSRSDSINYSVHKPKSKVALVIKTHKKPAVASAIQSQSRKFDRSSSSSSEETTSEESESESSEDASDDSSSSSSSDSESSSGDRSQNNRLHKPSPNVQMQKKQYKRK